MEYNFDEIINRQDTNAVSIDGFRKYLLNRNEVSELPYADNELIIMWVADMAFATAPEIIEALLKRVKHGIFGYTGILDSTYKKAFTNWAKSKYEWTINPDHIVTSQGVVPALYDLISYLCMPDEKILALTPSYAYFKLAADFNGNELITSQLICEKGNYFIDFEDIRAQIKAHNISLFILCSPHNPTGRLPYLKKVWGELLKLSKGISKIRCELVEAVLRFIQLFSMAMSEKVLLALEKIKSLFDNLNLKKYNNFVVLFELLFETIQKI